MSNVTGFRRFNSGWGGDVHSASTAQTLPNHGLSQLPSTGGVTSTYHLAAPVEGIEKVLFTNAASSSQVVSSTAAGATFVSTGGSTGTSLTLESTGASGALGTAVLLFGLSTSQWQVVSKVGTITPS